MLARLLFALCVLISTAAAAAGAGPGSSPADQEGRFVPGSDLDGTWEGVLSNGGMGFPMIFVITTRVGQGTSAVLDVADQAPKDIPVAGFRREKDTVVMDIPAVGGRFDGLVSADLATISGRWTQSGAAGAPVPLTLHRRAPGPP
jgi:hypothetical protein